VAARPIEKGNRGPYPRLEDPKEIDRFSEGGKYPSTKRVTSLLRNPGPSELLPQGSISITLASNGYMTSVP
jgi:hypothetical protein